MKPKVMFEFERGFRGDIPSRYRVVDKAGMTGSSDPKDTNAVIERFDYYDAMGGERWVPAGDIGVIHLLNELIYFTVTRNEPVEVQVPA